MRAADLATASILILLGAVVVLDSMRIGIGWGTDGPRSGFFPFWLGVILILASAAIAVQA
jgi:putative tricarboxylic transport membrane protein